MGGAAFYPLILLNVCIFFSAVSQPEFYAVSVAMVVLGSTVFQHLFFFSMIILDEQSCNNLFIYIKPHLSIYLPFNMSRQY